MISQGKLYRDISKTELIAATGTIGDIYGAVIPNAKVSFVNSKTKKSFKATTDNEGKFSIKNLPEGDYTAIFNAGGFKDYKVSKLQLNKNERLKFEVSLRPDDVSAVMGIK